MTGEGPLEAADAPERAPAAGAPWWGLLAAFAASGAAGLIYQVLWAKELGRIFGVTAHANAVTLGVFFLGLAVGGWVWGRRSGRSRRPLRTYALLELGIALSALAYFGLFAAYRELLPALIDAIGYQPAALLVFRTVLAVGILGVPAFLMGGTLPVMGEVVVRHRAELGVRASTLYAVNTGGAALGALAAGFLLPRWLGFDLSYLVAIGIDLGVAGLAWSWGGRPGEARVEPADHPPPGARLAGWSAVRLGWLAALSGFTMLALEILFTRMYAQVLQNSVYTFSIILAVFLAALAGGGALARRLCRAADPRAALAWLLIVTGALVALVPAGFELVAGDLDYRHSDLGFGAYLLTVILDTVLVLGAPLVAGGAIFPLLLKLAEGLREGPGRTIGRLAAINTFAGIAGSVAAGFLMLEWLGLWRSLLALIVLYWAAGALVFPALRRPVRIAALAGALAAGALLAGPYTGLSAVRVDEEEGEELVEVREGPLGTVAVVRSGGALQMKVNSSYNLGTSGSTPNQRFQTQLALALHGDARSVYFLGMGTGISAGAALDFPVERVVVTELDRSIIALSREHFEPWLNGLFEDPRAEVLAEDGRSWLAATDDRYDVIVGDIFLSFKAGVASLYTREHFAEVRESLAPGGLFVQWLPLFDMSEFEFEVIANTMNEVFPQVTLWRRSMSPRFPVYALVARSEPEALEPEALDAQWRRLVEAGVLDERLWFVNLPLAAYAGNVTALAGRYADRPINTDDRTVLEFAAPITERQRHRAGDGVRTLAWRALHEWCLGLLEAVGPESDPYLKRVPAPRCHEVRAGAAYYGFEVYRRLREPMAARAHWREYQRHLSRAGVVP
jgi:spermidine synthase